MEDKKNRIQMAFDTTLDIRAEIKICAAKRNISISAWINRAIYERIAKEKRDENTGNLPTVQE